MSNIQQKTKLKKINVEKINGKNKMIITTTNIRFSVPRILELIEIWEVGSFTKLSQLEITKKKKKKETLFRGWSFTIHQVEPII